MKNTLPNFLVVGAQKAGTTTFYDIFKNHPEVYLPEQKEIFFFDYNYSKGIEWYQNKAFKTVSNEKAIGEISPSYLHIECVPYNIYQLLGKNVKLIFLLREPVSRAFSAYRMYKKSPRYNKWTNDDFETLIKKEKEGKSDSNYIKQGMYHQNIQRYLKYFEKEKMLFIQFEGFVGENRNKTIAEICRFLSISPIKLRDNIHRIRGNTLQHTWLKILFSENFRLINWFRKKVLSNSSLTKIMKNLIYKDDPIEILSSKLKREIFNDVFKEDVIQLEKTININLNSWKQ